MSENTIGNCTGCNKVILEKDEHETQDLSGELFCLECMNDEEFQKAMREGGDDDTNGEDKS